MYQIKKNVVITYDFDVVKNTENVVDGIFRTLKGAKHYLNRKVQVYKDMGIAADMINAKRAEIYESETIDNKTYATQIFLTIEKVVD